MESLFKPKIGQLVSWKVSRLNNSEADEHLGLITEIKSETLVVVTFIKNNWVISLQVKNLKLLNDVES